MRIQIGHPSVQLAAGLIRRLALGAGCATALSVSAHADCQLIQLSEMPVTMRATKPTIGVRANGHDVRLVLDSGAFWSTLSFAKAEELNLRLRPLPRGVRITGIGGAAKAKIAKVDEFHFADWPLKDADFMVTGVPVGDGLLGQNILSLLDVEYDLSDGAVRFFHVDDCRDKALAYWAGDRPFNTVDLTEFDALPNMSTTYAYANGERLRVLIDTGASGTLLSERAAKRAGIDLRGDEVTAGGAIGGIGRRTRATWNVRLDTFKLGDEEVSNAPVRVTDANLPVDMILGADFLVSHRMLVSNTLKKIFFTYEGGAIFNTDAAAFEMDEDGELVAAAEVSNDDPVSADGFASRGAARHELEQFAAADADFAMAIQLEPDNAAHYLHRARTRLALKSPEQARQDVDAAIGLDPGYAEALILRARMRAATDADQAGALADAMAVTAVLTAQSDQRLGLGNLFETLKRPDLAIAEYTQWIGAHREDVRLPIAYNGRCWSRALSNTDLDEALDDCQTALKRAPGNTGFLDSRGLVRVRRGEFEQAREDYDLALKGNPNASWSYFGRSLANRGLGHAEAADADLAAAVKIDPGIEADARGFGLVE